MLRAGGRRAFLITTLAAAVALAACAEPSAPTVERASPMLSPPTSDRAEPPPVSDSADDAASPVDEPVVERSTSVGDPRLPSLGSATLDVSEYDVELRYEPAENTLAGTVVITGRVTAPTDQLAFDFQPVGSASTSEIDEVFVDGRRADFELADRELLIDPAALLPAGHVFEVSATVTTELARGGGIRAPGRPVRHGRWSVGRQRARRCQYVDACQRPSDRQSDVDVFHLGARRSHSGGERRARRQLHR